MGKKWIVLVDRYYVWTQQLKHKDTATVMGKLTSWFTEYGWPTHIRTDGGLQFRTEFTTICQDNSIIQELSSLHNPELNRLLAKLLIINNSMAQRYQTLWCWDPVCASQWRE